MATVLEIYQQLCREDRFPSADVTGGKQRKQRRQNLNTSVRYLAAAHDSTPETLSLTPEVEATYKERLRDYLLAQGKGHATIRNTINDIGQFLRIWRQLPPKTPIPQAPRTRVAWRDVIRAMHAESPYAHRTWLRKSRYTLPMAQWPADLRARYETFQEQRRDRNRAPTMRIRIKAMECYLGYLGMTGEARLNHLPPEARAKLELKRYQDDLKDITQTPQTLAWDDLFPVNHVRSYVTWNAWRMHTPQEAQVKERPPSKPTTQGKMVGEMVLRLAQTFKRKRDITALADYLQRLPLPRPMHNKKAPYHRFTHAELEQVALRLIDEARRIEIVDHGKYRCKNPGANAASRFALGLILMLGWRIPIRRRNWVEALIDTNLLHEEGTYRWHFEGDELKKGKSRGQTNVFDMEIAAEVVPFLDEYLHVWRPMLPHAETDKHLFLSAKERPGGMLSPVTLTEKLRVHVHRLTRKWISPHMLRTLFVSHAITAGVSVNSVAYRLNDTPKTVWGYYNEMYGEQEAAQANDYCRQAVSVGPLPTLTPLVIPDIPPAPRRPAVNPVQLTLIE